MAPFESFYYRPGAGGTTREFDSDVGALVWNNNASCATTPTGLASQLLGSDANGKSVHLGPFAMPLWRSDIAERMRVVTLAHDLQPHEAAIPFNVTGRRLGRPDFSGLGAPIQRRLRNLDSLGSHPLPFSYGLMTSFAASQPFFQGVGAVANHGGASKPLVLKVDSGFNAFLDQLQRAGIPGGFDALLEHYRAVYRDWLRFTGSTTVTRSRAFADYDSSVASLFGAPSLHSLLSAGPSTIVPTPTCAREPSDSGFISGVTGQGVTDTQLDLAAYLLTRTGSQSANYVFVVDGGIDGTGFAYDVHDSLSFGSVGGGQAKRTGCHLWNVLSKLASIIKQPGETAPGKIDLDETLIIIKTEFGRTPYRSIGGAPNAISNGRDHWPQGYCWALIGGPIATGNQGVVGSLVDGVSGDPTPAAADVPYTPTDVSAAALLGIGIDPFAAGNFQIGQLSGSLQGLDHEGTMQNLLDTVLGVS